MNIHVRYHLCLSSNITHLSSISRVHKTYMYVIWLVSKQLARINSLFIFVPIPVGNILLCCFHISYQEYWGKEVWCCFATSISSNWTDMRSKYESVLHYYIKMNNEIYLILAWWYSNEVILKKFDLISCVATIVQKILHHKIFFSREKLHWNLWTGKDNSWETMGTFLQNSKTLDWCCCFL